MGKSAVWEPVCLTEQDRVRDVITELHEVDFAPDAFGEMKIHYISQIKEGTVKAIMLGGDRAAKPDFARLSLNCVGGRGSRWGYETAFLTRRPAGLWMSRIIPKL